MFPLCYLTNRHAPPPPPHPPPTRPHTHTPHPKKHKNNSDNRKKSRRWWRKMYQWIFFRIKFINPNYHSVTFSWFHDGNSWTMPWKAHAPRIRDVHGRLGWRLNGHRLWWIASRKPPVIVTIKHRRCVSLSVCMSSVPGATGQNDDRWLSNCLL